MAAPPNALASVDGLIGEVLFFFLSSLPFPFSHTTKQGGPRHRRRKLLLDAYRFFLSPLFLPLLLSSFLILLSRQAATQKDVTEVANDPSNIDRFVFVCVCLFGCVYLCLFV